MNTDVDPLVVDGLKVRYGRVTAVDDVSFSVGRGEVYALLGRNGAGKSSTISCLVGQRRAAAGECRLLGLDSWKRRRRIMERVAVVPETPDLPPGISALELGRFLGRIRPVWNGLKIRPCLPPEWTRVETTRQFRGATYRIRIVRNAKLKGGTQEIVFNEHPLAGDVLPQTRGQLNDVMVTLGPASRQRQST